MHLAFLDMLRVNTEVHADLFYDEVVKRGIDPRQARTNAGALFKSFLAANYIILIKDKAVTSKRHGRQLLSCYKVNPNVKLPPKSE